METDDTATDEPVEPTGGQDAGRPGRPRRRGGKLRTDVMIVLLLAALGFAVTTQVRSQEEDGLESARTEDLVRILADLDAHRGRLLAEIDSLEETRRQLTTGEEGQAAALAEAGELADALGIMTGTLPATGPGLELELIPGDAPVRAATVLDAVEELRGAGAEAMQISGGGHTVRIVAGSYFLDDPNGLAVDGVVLTGPYRMTVIGDPETMATALNIPGGVVDAVERDGGTVMVHKPGAVTVNATRDQTEPEYAQPVEE